MPDRFDVLLAPFARLMVRHRVALPALVERLKGHYVQAAKAETVGKITDSRLSVMTGLQRRDVARLRDFALKPPRPLPQKTIVTRWLTDPETSGTDGPKDLARTGPHSFDTLSRSVLQDIHPRTLLDDLVTSGTVKFDPETDTVRLIKTAYIPATGTEEETRVLASNVGAHLTTALENTDQSDARNFDRTLSLSGLCQEDAETLHAAFSEGMAQLQADLLQQGRAMKKAAPGSHALKLGGYAHKQEKTAQ